MYCSSRDKPRRLGPNEGQPNLKRAISVSVQVGLSRSQSVLRFDEGLSLRVHSTLGNIYPIRSLNSISRPSLLFSSLLNPYSNF